MENETGHMCTVGRMDRKLEKAFTKMGWEMVYARSGINRETSLGRRSIRMEKECGRSRRHIFERVMPMTKSLAYETLMV